MDRAELEDLDRESLVVKAQAAGIRRARILTRPELIDELLRLDAGGDAAQLKRSRGFFGRARDLVARVVERGLHLPDAAERIRALSRGAPNDSTVLRPEPQALPTVTLAEIYAAQGHPARAIETLQRVLDREPEHAAARALLARLGDAAYVAPPPPLPPEPEVEPLTQEEIELASGAERGEEQESGWLDVLSGGAAPIRRDTIPQRAPWGETHGEAAGAPSECFAVPVPHGDAPGGGGARMLVRWRVSPGLLGERREASPGGRFVVRAHVITPGWDGPSAETRDVALDAEAEAAQMMIVGLPEPSVVRVAVGWLDAAGFVPLAHSPALELTASEGLAIWTLRGLVPLSPADPRVGTIARALEGLARGQTNQMTSSG